MSIRVLFEPAVGVVYRLMSEWNSVTTVVGSRIDILNIFVNSKFWFSIQFYPIPQKLLGDLSRIETSWVFGVNWCQRWLSAVLRDLGMRNERRTADIEMRASMCRALAVCERSEYHYLEPRLSHPRCINGYWTLASRGFTKEVKNTPHDVLSSLVQLSYSGTDPELLDRAHGYASKKLQKNPRKLMTPQIIKHRSYRKGRFSKLSEGGAATVLRRFETEYPKCKRKKVPSSSVVATLRVLLHGGHFSARHQSAVKPCFICGLRAGGNVEHFVRCRVINQALAMLRFYPRRLSPHGWLFVWANGRFGDHLHHQYSSRNHARLFPSVCHALNSYHSECRYNPERVWRLMPTNLCTVLINHARAMGLRLSTTEFQRR